LKLTNSGAFAGFGRKDVQDVVAAEVLQQLAENGSREWNEFKLHRRHRIGNFVQRCKKNNLSQRRQAAKKK